MGRFIAYYRVSTSRQGQSGLGLQAQETSVMAYLAARGGDLLDSFTDIESGAKDDRPELLKALRKCRLTGATLLIAKLDRLSRNRRFLLELADSKLDFVAVDMPEANSLTVGILACMADYERQLISERTKAALAAAKARGVKLGNPNLAATRKTTNTKAGRAAWRQKTEQHHNEMRSICNEMIAELGSLTVRELAAKLNQAGYKTITGRDWGAAQVWRVMAA